MACVLIPKYNFLNGYFRCPLPSETVDVEVKVKMMRGIHMFRRDRTMCNTWSTRLHPYPTFIRKMKTYLELEGKLCPNPGSKPKHNHNHAPAHLPKITIP